MKFSMAGVRYLLTWQTIRKVRVKEMPGMVNWIRLMARAAERTVMPCFAAARKGDAALYSVIRQSYRILVGSLR